jgi:hypothetical protein
MTTRAPEFTAVKAGSRVLAGVRKVIVDDDPTEYPDWERMSDNFCQNAIRGELVPVLKRYQADRNVECFVGGDNFIYWQKGNIERCVSPDVYIVPGVAQTALPMDFGDKENGSWKIWHLGVAPNFALEVKSFKNARKDELQSPERHDQLGVEELIVFDPHWQRRRNKEERKRFCVYRRNPNNEFVIVLNTNADRVKSEILDAFLVCQGEGDKSMLRLGIGPNGDELYPFESERADMAAQRANQEARLRLEEARLRLEEKQRADQEARLRLEEKQRADQEARLRLEEKQRGDEEARLRLEEKQRGDEEARLRLEEKQRADEEARLRLEEKQRVDQEVRLRLEEARRADEQARLRLEEARRADEEARLRLEEKQRADEQARRADEATRSADEATRRAAELEAELARLRAGASTKRGKRRT